MTTLFTKTLHIKVKSNSYAWLNQAALEVNQGGTGRMRYALSLSQLIKWVEQQPAHIDPFVLGPVRSLLGELQSSNLVLRNLGAQAGQ